MRGNAVHCPICDGKFRKFLPYGRLKPRENALCPQCLSLERHRLMYLYLKERTNFFTDSLKVLHVAPEYCFLHRFRKLSNLDYLSADIESPLADIKMDIEQIQFEENTFDVIFCNHVLEHVNDFEKAAKELNRVLKPGGWAILQSPQDLNLPHTIEDPSITDPRERERIFLQSDHLRLFGRDYANELERGGFEVVEDRFVQEIGIDRAKLFALPLEETIYLSKK